MSVCDIDFGLELRKAHEEGYAAGRRDVVKWHNAKHVLPGAANYGEALLVTDGEFIHMAYFNNGEWYFCESGEMKEKMFYEVAYWMELPEQPKEG